MGDEIEKKFLIYRNNTYFAKRTLNVIHDTLTELRKYNCTFGVNIKQGYLTTKDGRTLNDIIDLQPRFVPTEYRLRSTEGKHTYTIKEVGGQKRPELEIALDSDLFLDFWNKTEGRRIFKRRHNKNYTLQIPACELPTDLRVANPTHIQLTTEVDVYMDRDLIIAENEIKHTAILNHIIPVGVDVTDIGSFKNTYLAK